jgi:fatty acid-binding protein DegV
VNKKAKIVFDPTPPVLRKRGLMMSHDQIAEQIKAEFAEEHEKLLALCVQYEISHGTSMFYQLSLALAREFLPKQKRVGRKSKWTILNQGALVVEVERLIEEGNSNHGASWAAVQLALREPWKSFVEKRDE